MKDSVVINGVENYLHPTFDDIDKSLELLETYHIAVLLGLYLLPISFWMISTGLMPHCSQPTTGVKSRRKYRPCKYAFRIPPFCEISVITQG